MRPPSGRAPTPHRREPGAPQLSVPVVKPTLPTAKLTNHVVCKFGVVSIAVGYARCGLVRRLTLLLELMNPTKALNGQGGSHSRAGCVRHRRWRVHRSWRLRLVRDTRNAHSS